MKPQWYCEAMPLVVGGDTGTSGPILRSRILGLLHGVFARHPRTFAVAFPHADKLPSLSGPLTGALRVFASTRDALDTLAAQVSVQPWFRDYARLSYPRAVPENFDGAWIRFVRYRVPSLSSDRHEGAAHGQLRQQRMDVAYRAGLTYFILHSAGTGQRFSLLVQCEAGEPNTEECTPNGYGFCTVSHPFSLPDLSWA